MEGVWIEAVLIVVGILANGFFAGSEIALVSARTGRLAQLRQRGLRGATTAMQLKENPQAFLATIQIAITAVGTLASAVGGATAVEALTPELVRLGFGQWAGPVALAVVIVIITYVSLVVGELTPKAIALRNPERLAAFVAGPISRISRASSWLVWVLTASTNALLRVLGLGKTQDSPFISEEEVRYLVREGTAKGIFEKVEEELVHNAFEFADTTVREIMVPSLSIKGLDLGTPPDEVLKRAVDIGHTRIPVYRGTIANVVGVVVIKDLLRACAQHHRAALAELVRPPVFVPEFSPISAVLREFQRKRQQLAMVVDEYGAVVGLVTVEDILEEIVGDISDEREGDTTALVRRLPDGSAIVEGLAPVAEVRKALGIDLPESPHYNTVAGFVISSLDAIPSPGAKLKSAGHRWTVLEMDGPRITRVRVEPSARTEAA
jgi:putative hemolysin